MLFDHLEMCNIINRVSKFVTISYGTVIIHIHPEKVRQRQKIEKSCPALLAEICN